MSRISYQAILDGSRPGSERYVPLPPDAVSTRRKDAARKLRVQISDAQRAWLKEVVGVSGDPVDEDAVVRALLDLGMSLDVDWPLVSGGRALREAVRDAVRVRREAAEPRGG